MQLGETSLVSTVNTRKQKNLGFKVIKTYVPDKKKLERFLYSKKVNSAKQIIQNFTTPYTRGDKIFEIDIKAHRFLASLTPKNSFLDIFSNTLQAHFQKWKETHFLRLCGQYFLTAPTLAHLSTTWRASVTINEEQRSYTITHYSEFNDVFQGSFPLQVT